MASTLKHASNHQPCPNPRTLTPDWTHYPTDPNLQILRLNTLNLTPIPCTLSPIPSALYPTPFAPHPTPCAHTSHPRSPGLQAPRPRRFQHHSGSSVSLASKTYSKKQIHDPQYLTVSSRALNPAVQRPPEKLMNLGILTVCPYSLTVAGALHLKPTVRNKYMIPNT